MSEIPLPTVLQIAVSLYGYFLPLMLYAAWSTLAFYDLGQRTDASKGTTLGWSAVVLLVPFVGALLYHTIGGSRLSRPLRAAIVGGGLVMFALALVAGHLLGGAA